MKLRTADYDIGYPAYDAKFLNNNTLLVTGGGQGEPSQGTPNINRLTALTINFEKRKVVKKFRELKLDDQNDSPTVLDAENNLILVGCNESAQSIRAGHNHSLQKYAYTNEHLKYHQSVSLETISVPLQYQKLIRLSHDGSMAAIATSKVPTVIHILDAVRLFEKYEITTNNDVKALDISPDGKLLAYITQSTLEIISIVTGKSIMRKTDFKSSLSKVLFQDNDNVLIAANLKDQGGITVIRLSISKKLNVTKSSLVSKKIKDITSMDINVKNALVALAGSDNSVTLLKLNSLKLIKTFSNVHSFNITKVAFSPDGQFLASVSAAKSINVIEITESLGVETHRIYHFFVKVFQLCIFVVLCGAGWLFYQYRESQQLPDISDYFTLVQKTQTNSDEPTSSTIVSIPDATTSSFEQTKTLLKRKVLHRNSEAITTTTVAEVDEYTGDDYDEQYEDEEYEVEVEAELEDEQGGYIQSELQFDEQIESITSIAAPSETSFEILEPELAAEDIEPETTELSTILSTDITEESTALSSVPVGNAPEIQDVLHVNLSEDLITSSTASTATTKEVTSTKKPITLRASSQTVSSSLESKASLTPLVTELTPSGTPVSSAEALSTSSLSKKKKKSKTKTKKAKTSTKKKTKRSKKSTSSSESSESDTVNENESNFISLTTSEIEFESMGVPDTSLSIGTSTSTELLLESMTTPNVEEVSTDSTTSTPVSEEPSSTDPETTIPTLIREPMVLKPLTTVRTPVVSTDDFEQIVSVNVDVEQDQKQDFLSELKEISIQAEIVGEIQNATDELDKETHDSSPESGDVSLLDEDSYFTTENQQDTASILSLTTSEPDASPEPELLQIPETPVELSHEIFPEDLTPLDVETSNSIDELHSTVASVVAEPTEEIITEDGIYGSLSDDSGDEADNESEEDTETDIDSDETLGDVKSALAGVSDSSSDVDQAGIQADEEEDESTTDEESSTQESSSEDEVNTPVDADGISETVLPETNETLTEEVGDLEDLEDHDAASLETIESTEYISSTAPIVPVDNSAAEKFEVIDGTQILKPVTHTINADIVDSESLGTYVDDNLLEEHNVEKVQDDVQEEEQEGEEEEESSSGEDDGSSEEDAREDDDSSEEELTYGHNSEPVATETAEDNNNKTASEPDVVPYEVESGTSVAENSAHDEEDSTDDNESSDSGNTSDGEESGEEDGSSDEEELVEEGEENEEDTGEEDELTDKEEGDEDDDTADDEGNITEEHFVEDKEMEIKEENVEPVHDEL